MVRGVVVAAGYGTRFLPITRSLPKEMLPIGLRPAIDYVIAEMAEAGVEEILLITSRRKAALDSWFDRDPELELACADAPAKRSKLAPPDVRVSFVRQTQMRGTGHALLLARSFAGDQPVIVAYPDDLFVGAPNASSQLINTWRATGCSVMGCIDKSGEDVSRYGVLDVVDGNSDAPQVRDFVEKPAPGEEPSSLVSLGRYLVTPDFFEPLAEGWRTHSGGEYFHVHALRTLAEKGRLRAAILAADHLDTGAPSGYMRAVVDAALADPETYPGFRSWLESRLSR